MTRGPWAHAAAVEELERLWREADEKLEQCLAFAREQGFSILDQNHIEYAKQHVGTCTQFAHTHPDPERRYWELCETLDRDLMNERWQRDAKRRLDGRPPLTGVEMDVLPHKRVWIICPRTYAEERKFEYLTRRAPFGQAIFASRNVLFEGDDPVFAIAPGQ